MERSIPAPGGPKRMVRSCWAGVGGVGIFGTFSSASIFALSWETSDFRYSSSSEAPMTVEKECTRSEQSRCRSLSGLRLKSPDKK